MDTENRFKAAAAQAYEQRIRTLIPAYEVVHQMTNALLRSRLNEEAEILVAGCGTGMELSQLGINNEHWHLTGIDPSEDMLEIARRNTMGGTLEKRINLRLGKVADLPRDQKYDAATLILVMHFLPDDGSKLSLLQDIAALLKPGAALVLVDLCGDPTSEQGAMLMPAWNEHQVLQGASREKVEERMKERMDVVQYISEERTRMLLHEAGFHRTQCFLQAFLLKGLITIKK